MKWLVTRWLLRRYMGKSLVTEGKSPKSQIPNSKFQGSSCLNRIDRFKKKIISFIYFPLIFVI
jgi:hypothetical protein